MAPEFQLYQDKQGSFRWRMRAGNGRIIAVSSEGYVGKADALHGIRLVQEGDIGHTEIFTDRRGEYRWRQVADNGRIIATGGEGFTRLDDCKHSLGLVYSLASQTPLNDLTAGTVDALEAEHFT